MAYISHWYVKSYNVLEMALDCIAPGEMDKRIIRAVTREAYPFAERKGWAYKQYCRARRLILWQRYPRLFKAPPSALRGLSHGRDVVGQMPIPFEAPLCRS